MIVHLDADAFFASVEQAAHPRLRGRPVAVGGLKRGIVASASYEARKYGIYTPMPTARAKKLCPHLTVLPGDFEQYEKFSRFMFSYAYDFTPLVEVGSIDEGYFDLRGNSKRSPEEVARIIRTVIRQTLKISVSEGIASNKVVSAIASKLKKPACFIQVDPGSEREFLAPLQSRWLPGIGPALAETFNQAGLKTIGTIARLAPDQLATLAGAQARQIWEFANGVDSRPVIPESPEARSWSEQETFEQDSTDEEWVLAKLKSMADRLFHKVRMAGKAIRTVEVRLRYNDFQDVRRSESLEEPTHLESDSYPALTRLLKKAWERRVSLRCVGLKLAQIYPAVFQEPLPWNASERRVPERHQMAHAVDQIREQYGRTAIMRGHDLWLKVQPITKEASPLRKRSARSLRWEWAPLNFKSVFSFNNALLRPEEIVELAVNNGCRALAVTDPNLHGAVELAMAAQKAGVKPVIAAEVRVGEHGWVAYVKNRTGYENLCRALSGEGNQLLPDQREGLLLKPAGWLPEIRYASPEERKMFSILQAIRTRTRWQESAPEKLSGDFHFPRSVELTGWSEQLSASLEIADACDFAFEFGKLKVPGFIPPDGSDSNAFLRVLTGEGMRARYCNQPGLMKRVRSQIERELCLINDVGYADYFLLVWDILQDCRRKGIEWITRGSAADSLVCYCLGISDVCPIRFELYFQRFLNPERMKMSKLPDIDIDFAHDRKDAVVDLIFQKYGARAAVVGGFSTYQGRSAFAEVAKIMGVSDGQVRRLTDHFPRTSAPHLAAAIRESEECRDLPLEEEPYRTALALAAKLDGLPRHPKMHPCGVVLASSPIEDLSPVFRSNKGYPTTHFDMEGVEALGLVKMDILAQGGLAVIRDTLHLLQNREIRPRLKKLAPWKDPKIWEMIQSGQARGVHHIESPAMTTLAKMVRVSHIDDLIAIVSVIRPGAANNFKKEQFARRAQGYEEPTGLPDCLKPILAKTHGVVAYEEHILQICETFAGITPGSADRLRRALVKGKSAEIAGMQEEFVRSAHALHRPPEEIASVWNLIAGFQGYAFCRAHSTAYGIEAYEAAYLKCYHPVEFLACVLTHGKGFYDRLFYTMECRRLKIRLLTPDINVSGDAFLPEGHQAIRVPLRQVKGMTEAVLQRWNHGKPFVSMTDFYFRAMPGPAEMEALIRVGAFDVLEPSRVRQYWKFRQLQRYHGHGGETGLFDRLTEGSLPVPDELTEPGREERLTWESELLGFPVSGHPLDRFPDVAWDTYCSIASAFAYSGKVITVAGVIVADRLHKQVDGQPMKFISLCDPSGILECELFADTYRRYGAVTVRYPVVEVTGKVEPFFNGNGFHFTVRHMGPVRMKKSS